MIQAIQTQGLSANLRESLLQWGFSERNSNYIVDFLGLFIVLFVSVLVYYILKFAINRFLKRMVLRTVSKWDDHLYEQKVFTRLALIVPALIIEVFLPATISGYPGVIHFLEVLLSLYSAIVMIIVANSFLNAVYHIYGDLQLADSKPIKGYVQIGKIIVFVIGAIVLISMLIGQSPLTLLAGLGAMSAVLLLIFRDSILGFVAGVQISTNNMLHIGDWMTMPKFNVDGVVIDISLVIVKVRNFDNSVSMIPTYSLITDSYQNWRNMLEAGGRRLRRSVNIDLSSVKNIDNAFVEKINKYSIPDQILLSENMKVTNLGVFRWYLHDLLTKHHHVNQQMIILVRLLVPVENGIPLEYTVYSVIEDLADYENFQSSIMEQVLATLPDFDLKVYQRPASQQTELGKNI
jgi:miniconductance mechanosensitive channel